MADSQHRSAPGLWRVFPYLVLGAVVGFMARGVLADINGRFIGLLWDRSWLEGTAWWYWSIARLPFDGINPLHNTLQGYPIGINHLMLNGNFGDALMAAPLFWAARLPAAYNLAVVGFVLFNGVAAYVGFRAWLGGRIIPLGLALVVTVHPFFLQFVDEGRPTQLVVGWVFLGLAGLKELLSDPKRPIRKLTVGLIGAFVCFWFYGLFAAFLVLVLVATTARRYPAPERRQVFKRTLKAAVVTVVVCFPFGLPLLVQALSDDGIQAVEMLGRLEPARWTANSATPLDPLMLEPAHAVWLPYTACALLCFGAVRAMVRCLLRRGASDHRRRLATSSGPDVWLGGFGAAIALFYTLLLGPALQWGDGPLYLFDDTPVWLPWVALHQVLPFFSRLSYPYLAFPFLLIGVLVLAGAVLGTLPRPGAWALAALLAAEVLLRTTPTLVTSPFTVPPSYHHIAADPAGEALIEYPFGMTDFRQVFQPIHRKAMLGAEGHERSFLDWPGMPELIHGTPLFAKLYRRQTHGTPLSRITDDDIRQAVRLGFGHLVLSRRGCRAARMLMRLDYQEVRRELIGVFGQPWVQDDAVVVFRLARDETSAPPHRVSAPNAPAR